VRRVVNGAARIFTYDGWKPILEWDGAGNWLAQNIYGAGPDEILGRYDSIGRALTYKRDKQGNVVALLGNDGSVVEKYSYDAFGQPTVTDYWGYVRAGSIHENRFMFTGREWIKELGIYDYRNRFYHPGLGRFLQSDPLGLQTEGVKLTAGEKALFSPGGTAPEAFGSSETNLYRYCGDDPVDRSDPMGLDPVIIDAASDSSAQQANAGNLQAYKNSFWPQEYGTAVNRDASGALTLNGPISNSFFQAVIMMRDSVPFERFVGGQTIIVTHNHTNQKYRDTRSHLSTGDIKAGNISGKPIYVITPNGQQDRYRPSNRDSVKERFNDPGVIERLNNGKWDPIQGANPDIRGKPDVDPKLWK
jgi:RHS repeat-associated protein